MKQLNGTLETTKKDKKNHGFGTGIIKKILKKYDGYMEIRTDGEKFMLKASYKRDDRYLYKDDDSES